MNKNRTQLKLTRQVLITGCLAVATILLGSVQVNADDANQSQFGQIDSARVDVKVSKSSMQIAEPFTFGLTVTAPAGTKVALPAMGAKFGNFEIIDHKDVNDIPSASASDERIWTRQMTLESIFTGELQIPAMDIQVSDGPNSRIIKSDAIPVRVISVLEDRADPTQFRDIHSVVDVDVPPQKTDGWFWWAAGGLGLLTFGSAAIAVVARRRTWLTPSEWALRELESLHQSEAMQSGDCEGVSLQLSSILRDYLALQFEISAPVQTTQELMHAVESKQLMNSETTTGFSQIFEAADQAKFAGLQLTTFELSNAINDSRDLVVQTSNELESQIHSSETTEAN